MRTLLFLVIISVVGVGGWYGWENFGSLTQFVQNKIPSSEFKTLEIRYSAEEIMQDHKSELLKHSGYTFLEPKLLFYPYLWMDVKYAKNRGLTEEGILLWGLFDGEMVLQTSTWEKTHGFEDCLVAKAEKDDFKIIESLEASGGAADREKLYSLLNVDPKVIDGWIESCRSKKLIVLSGNKFRLHFQNPHLPTEPITSFDQSLVKLTTKNAQRVKGHYSVSAIKKLSQIVFGEDFAIRRTQEVFLPVYAIAVQNPDGSVLTSHWNAVNGKKI